MDRHNTITAKARDGGVDVRRQLEDEEIGHHDVPEGSR
jgi:hypothetical protein